MDSENKKLSDLLKEIPAESDALSISRVMSQDGTNEIIIKHDLNQGPEVEYRESHVFENLETFFKYIEKYKSAYTTIYYDKNNSCCHCVLNEVDSDGGAAVLICNIDTGSLKNKISFIESIDNRVSFLRFLKKNKKNIPNFMNLYHIMSALKVSSSIEKLDVIGKKSENSFIVKTEFKGQVKGEPVELPDVMDVLFNDYSMSFEKPVPYLINVDLYYSASKDGSLMVDPVVSNTEELCNKQDKTFYGFIKENAPGDVLVTIGRPKYRQVERHQAGSRY